MPGHGASGRVAGLLQDRLSEAHVSTLYGGWQMPMYEIDFSPIPVTLEEIKAQRDAAFWNEVGGFDA